MRYRLSEKMVPIQEAFSGKKFACCTLTVKYEKYDFGGIFTVVLCALVNMSCEVVL